MELQISPMIREKLHQHMENVIDILFVATGKDIRMVEELKTNKHTLKLEEFDCYEKLISSYLENCFKLSENPYGLR